MTALLEGSRLVTLVGAPGIGKSRLGLELARGLTGGAFEGGWLVELAPVADGALVAKAVAAAVSVKEAPGETLTDSVIARLGSRRVLLVLDNCEHLLGACTELVDALLCGCPELRILATSREALGIVGERVWQVPPLSVPDSGESLLPERLMGYDAVSLFVERASAVQSEFSLGPDSASGVAEISRRLDGIPLAIELAAARVATLTPAEIARRLDDRFALLRNGTGSRLPRHQTLQAAVDWSHELLSAAERTLLRRLSVFLGGFCLEAAETVCADGQLESSQVLDVLTGLVSKSLVVADTANTSGRYHLLETIRAYAHVRLEEADEVEMLGEAHARYYLTLAERAEPELTGSDQEHWFERLETERENLRSAIHWSLNHVRIDWALHLTGALVLFWRIRCHFSEGRELLETAVQASDSQDEASALRAKALWGAGFMALMAGRTDQALVPLERSLAEFRELDDLQGAGRTLLILGDVRVVQNDPRARTLLEESAALARDAGDPWCLAHALGVMGYANLAVNELPAARPLFEECVAVAGEAEDMQGRRYGLIGLGRVAAKQGDYSSAESLLEEALSIARKLGEDYIVAGALQTLGEVALGRGNYERAEALLEDARAVLPDIAPVEAALRPLIGLARVAYAQGDHVRARLLFEEVLTANGIFGTSIAALGLGELLAGEGDTGRAQQLLDDVLERGREKGDTWLTARSLHGLGHLARSAGDAKQAAVLHTEALELQHQLGDAPGVASSLEALAGLAAAGGRHLHAARVLGAAQALRDANGYARAPQDAARHRHDAAHIREALTTPKFDEAFTQGARLSVDEVMKQVSRGRGRRGRPGSGWSSLTDAEQNVAELVAEGLSNREIGERLFITVGTVKNHMSHIFSKLGIRGRVRLAREVRRQQDQFSADK